MRRNTVRVVDYDQNWPILYASEWESLRRVLGGLAVDVEHVGSTAVPGLPAKPILDIAIAAGTLDLVQGIAELLADINYAYRGDIRGDGRRKRYTWH